MHNVLVPLAIGQIKNMLASERLCSIHGSWKLHVLVRIIVGSQLTSLALESLHLYMYVFDLYFGLKLLFAIL